MLHHLIRLVIVRRLHVSRIDNKYRDNVSFIYRSYRFRCTCAARWRWFGFLRNRRHVFPFAYVSRRSGLAIMPGQRVERVRECIPCRSTSVDCPYSRTIVGNRESLLLNTTTSCWFLHDLQNIHLVLGTLIVCRNTPLLPLPLFLYSRRISSALLTVRGVKRGTRVGSSRSHEFVRDGPAFPFVRPRNRRSRSSHVAHDSYSAEEGRRHL